MRSAIRSFFALLLGIAVVTCVDRATGRGSAADAGAHATFAVAAAFSTAAQQAAPVYDLNGYTVDHVHVIVKLGTAVLKDTSVAYSSSDGNVSLDLSILADPGDQLTYTLDYLSGVTVLYSGAGTATAFISGGSPPTSQTPATILPVGPGATAAHVTVAPASGSFSTATPIPFTATVTDATNAPIAGALLSWTVSDPTLATIGATTGVLQPLGKRGSVIVTAATLDGIAGQATVTLVPPPAKLVVTSGNGQSADAGSALSPVVVQLQATDGLGVAGQTVTFGTTSGGGSIAPLTVVTDANGNALTVPTLGTTPGANSYNASAAGFTTTIAATANPAAVATLTGVAGDGQTDSVKKTLASPLVVKAADKFGNPRSGVTITWARTAGSGSTSATTTTTGSDGTTSIAYTLGATVGTETVTATATGVTTPVTFNLHTTAGGPATITAVSGSGQSAAVSQPFGAQLVARVLDKSGNPVAGAHVAWTIVGGTLPSSQATSDATGQATANIVAGASAGPLVVTATLDNAATVQFTETVTSSVSTATQMASNGGSVTGTVHAAVSTPPSVIVKDALGSPVSGVTVTFAVGLGGGSITGQTPTTNASGIAAVGSWTLGTTVGTNTLTATVTGLTGSPVTFTAAGVADVASALFFTTQPASTTLNTGVPVVVTARDAFGNTATSFVGPVTLTILANPGDAGLAGAAPVLSAGVTTFSSVLVNSIANGYTLQAAATGVTSATSAPFNITAAAPAVIQWNAPSGGSWSNPANWNLARVPISTDSVVIAAAGTYTVTLDTTFTGKSITVGGGTGTQTLSLSSRTLTVTNAVTILPSGSFTLTSSTVVGINSFVNQGLVVLVSSTLALPVVNQATLAMQAGSAITGAFVTGVTSSVLIEGNASCCAATVGIASGFTNNGTIQLTAVNGINGGNNNASLAIATGTLINSSSGTISIVPGTGNGARTLTAELVNHGIVSVSSPFTLTAPTATAANVNTGVINVLSGGSVTVSQSGTSSFTNSGTISVASATQFSVVAGSFTENPGATLSGAGGFVLSTATASFNAGFTIASFTATSSTATLFTGIGAGTTLSLASSTVNGSGTITVSPTLTATIANTNVNAPIDNQGTLAVTGLSTFTGALTAEAGSTLLVEGNASCCAAALTISNGFANLGTIQLTAINGSNGGSNNAALTVTSGTLVNGATGVISASAGTGTASRTLTAALNNQGTVNVNVPLTINGVSAVHSNTGTINVNAALTLTQSGTAPTFTNTGILTVASGQTMNVTGGAFTNQAGASLSGAGTLGLFSVPIANLNGSIGISTLTINTTTATLASGLSTAATTLNVTTATINGPGALTTGAGQTTTIVSSTINAPLDNFGTLALQGTTAINGVVTTELGSTMLVEGNAICCGATVTFATGFTNNATLQLTAANGSNGGNNNAILLVTAGTLANASTGTISVLQGTGPGTRTITAPFDNQGTINVNAPLSLNETSATYSNSGALNVNAALTLTQAGTSPTFTSVAGTISVASGQTFSVNGGTFAYNGGTVVGPGTLALNNTTMNLAAAFSNAAAPITVSNTTINGPATLTNAVGQSLTLSIATVNAPLTNLGTLNINGTVALNGTFTAAAGSQLLDQANAGFSPALLTVANGFTNNGAIQLTTINGSNGGNNNASMTITAGTLVNASGATISAEPGTGIGSRTLTAPITNQSGGTITIDAGLTINAVNAAHSNSGAINVNAGLTITQSGTSPSFTNLGTMTLASGQIITVNGGSFTDQAGGTLTGPGNLFFNGVVAGNINASINVGSLTLTSSTTTLASGISTASTSVNISGGSVLNGPGTLTNGSAQTTTITGSTINAPVDNFGILDLQGSVGLNGTVSNEVGATLVALANAGLAPSIVTVANGFTNLGAIQLTTINGSNGGNNNASIAVTAGTLQNAAGASISSLVGTGLGSRTLTAQVNNNSSGTITVSAPLTINGLSAIHSNSGAINVNAGLTITQGGTSPSFTNLGTITVASGQTFTVSGGSFTQQVGATLTGAGGVALTNVTAGAINTSISVASLALTTSAASIASGISTANTAVSISTGSTLNGPGTLTNGAAQTTLISASTINAPVDNFGILNLQGTVGLNGALSNEVGSTLAVQANAGFSPAIVTVATGFTNNGAIQLTTINGSNGGNNNASLTVSSGTLQNVSGATISSLVGTGAGSRTLTAQINNNLGAISVSSPLTINGANATHTNSGTITATADLTITQTGVSPTFTNTGTMAVTTGRTLTVNGGTFTDQAGGTLTGAGALALNNVTASTIDASLAIAILDMTGSVGTLGSGISTANTNLSISGGSTLNGPGTLTNGIGLSMTITGSTINAPVDNFGLLSLQSTVVLGGAVSNESTGTLVIQGNASVAPSVVTVATGFTNLGVIQFTTSNGSNGGNNNASMTVTSGTLVNDVNGTISTPLGTAVGAYTLTARLNNQGALTLATPLTINGPNANHINSGTITVNAPLTVTQSGSTPSFMNSGTIAVASGQTFTVNGGTFTHQVPGILNGGGSLALNNVTGGTFSNSFSVGTLTLSGTTTTLSVPMSTATTSLIVTSSVINGAGVITNPSPQNTNVFSGTINTPFVNGGTLALQGSSALNGALTASAGSTLMIEANAGVAPAAVTISTGFTNNGTILFTTVNGSNGGNNNATLAVTGLLTNSATGIITVQAGTGSGSRTLTTTVDNFGTLNLYPTAAGSFTINGDVSMESTSTLDLNIGGTAQGSTYDLLSLGAPGHYFTIGGGTLNVQLVNAYAPANGLHFTTVTAPTAVSGAFTAVNLPTVAWTLSPFSGSTMVINGPP